MDNTLSGPVDVLAVLREYAQNTGSFRVTKQGATSVAAACAAVVELIEALHTRRMELGRRGGNMFTSTLRAEWEFLGEVLARVGGAK